VDIFGAFAQGADSLVPLFESDPELLEMKKQWLPLTGAPDGQAPWAWTSGAKASKPQINSIFFIDRHLMGIMADPQSGLESRPSCSGLLVLRGTVYLASQVPTTGPLASFGTGHAATDRIEPIDRAK
jgi:hypothetical protein